MIDRRSLLSLGLGAGAAGLVGAASARAQQQDRPFRILMITFRGETEVERGFKDFFQAADVKAEFIMRDANRDPRNVPGLIADRATLKPDLIYTWGTSVTLGVLGPLGNTNPAFVHDTPVVFALVATPVRSGIAQSFQSSGRNVTGAVHVVPTDVQMRAMQAYLPFKKMGILYSTNEQNSTVIVEEARAIGARTGVEVIAQPFRTNSAGLPTADGVADLIRQMRADKAEWLYLLPDTFLGTIYNQVTPVALDAGLPTFAAAELGVREGGALVGLVSRYYSVGQLAASKAIEILVEGKKPEQIPIETLKRFSLIINMRVAKTLGVYPPIAMLNYAEIVTG